MTELADLPRLIRAGFVVLDKDTGRPRRVIRLQYNPDRFTRTLEVRENNERGPGTPPEESFSFEAEFNADEDTLGRPPLITGVAARIAALAALVTPRVSAQQQIEAEAQKGLLAIGAESPDLVLFNWGPRLIAPVRLTEFRVTEEAFAFDLTPIRAQVSLGMRVLRPQELRFDTLGGGFAVAYQHQRQALADLGRGDLV